ncbi:MAG: MJ0042-type zinc finger domain-containing protein [Acidobacteriota bacterium]
MGAVNERVDVVCPRCGATFTAFLKQMAAQNQKVVCPKCGGEQDCGQVDAPSSQATRKP